MAHRVLSADMTKLVEAMRQVQQDTGNPAERDKRIKNMLKAAHVLALNSKDLYDTVDAARKRDTGGVVQQFVPPAHAFSDTGFTSDSCTSDNESITGGSHVLSAHATDSEC